MNDIIPQSIEAKLRSLDERSPELDELMRNARRASDFLKVLAHESRLILLCLLSARERSVGELEEILSLRQPTLSQQLARLRYDKLVTTRREGKTIYYSLADQNVRDVLAVIYRTFCKGTPSDAAH
ncbi:MAG: metalloregulator ArsR/SmtB family transcription factor [Alphaproteobacteria bacterium]|nr:metalloregulator ArsR/SmtB family transcription factor [Alphaproteobacteria bacterium]